MLIITDENGTIALPYPSRQGVGDSNSSSSVFPVVGVGAFVGDIINLFHPNNIIMAKSHHNSSLTMEDVDPSTNSALTSATTAATVAAELLSKHSNIVGEKEEDIPETSFEFDSDVLLAVAFLITAIVAAKRLVHIDVVIKCLSIVVCLEVGCHWLFFAEWQIMSNHVLTLSLFSSCPK